MYRPVGAPAYLVVHHVNTKWKPSPMSCSIPASDHMRKRQHTTKCDSVCVKLAPWNLPTDTKRG